MDEEYHAHIKRELVSGRVIFIRQRSFHFRLTPRHLEHSVTSVSVQSQDGAESATHRDSDSREHVIHENIIRMILIDKVADQHSRPQCCEITTTASSSTPPPHTTPAHTTASYPSCDDGWSFFYRSSSFDFLLRLNLFRRSIASDYCRLTRYR